MVIGYNVNVDNYKYVIAGGVSGSITRGLFQPLDVLKIRFQLQVESFNSKSGGKYRGMYQALSTIVTEEGVGALWKGHVPGQSLSILYGGVQFFAIEFVSKQLSFWYPSASQMPHTDFLCGVIGSTSATVISFPFDVIKTRLVAQSNQNKVYSGTINAFLQILKKENIFTLFRGLTPTLVQVAPQGGVQLAVYNFSSHLCSYSSHLSYQDSQGCHLKSGVSLITGSVSGLVSKASVYPLDLAKKRIQIQGFDEARITFGKTFKCKNLIDCIRRTYEQESVRGLYKGLAPSLLKASLTSASYFFVYENTLSLLK